MDFNPKVEALKLLAKKGWEDLKESASEAIDPIKRAIKPLNDTLDDLEGKALKQEEDSDKRLINVLNEARKLRGEEPMDAKSMAAYKGAKDLTKEAAMAVGTIKPYKGSAKGFGTDTGFSEKTTPLDDVMTPEKLKEIKESLVENASDEVVEGLKPQAKFDPSQYTPSGKHELKFEKLKQSFGRSNPVAELSPDTLAGERAAKKLTKDRLLHGTNQDFIDPAILGKEDLRKLPESAEAFFLTKDPEFANKFSAMTRDAPSKGSRSMGFMAEPQKTFDPRSISARKAMSQKLIEQGRDPEDVKSILTELADKKNSWEAFESEPGIIQAMKDLGYDSFRLTEQGVDNLAILDPNVLQGSMRSSKTPEISKAIKDKILKDKLSKIKSADDEYVKELLSKLKD